MNFLIFQNITILIFDIATVIVVAPLHSKRQKRKVTEIFKLSFQLCRAITLERAIKIRSKELIKNGAKTIKSDNFTRSNREK